MHSLPGTCRNSAGCWVYRLRLLAHGRFVYEEIGHIDADHFRASGTYRLDHGAVVLTWNRPTEGERADLPTRLIPVPRGGGLYLIPEESMANFCAYCAEWPNPGDPRLKEGWDTYYLRGAREADEVEAEGDPRLPPEWRPYYESLLAHRLPSSTPAAVR
jgi:hypothetical protein